MNKNQIDQLAADVAEARKNLDTVRTTIQENERLLAKAKADRDEVQAQITNGDLSAMVDITDMRAIVDGHEEFLKDLEGAETGAQSKLRHVEALHTQARVEALDIPGIMSPKEISDGWKTVKDTFDKVFKPFTEKLYAHNEALEELGQLIERSQKVLGDERNTTRRAYDSYGVVMNVNVAGHGTITRNVLTNDHSNEFMVNIGRALERYPSPELLAAREQMESRRETSAVEAKRLQDSYVNHADIQRAAKFNSNSPAPLR